LTAALRRSFASLQIPNYRRYFAGQLASLSGNWVQIVAEMWLVLTLTGSGLAVGLTSALQFLPFLLFGAWGGVLADRLAKRRLLLITQPLMALPALALFAFTVTEAIQPWMVYALVFARGTANAVDHPTRQSFVIEMVGGDRVVNAVSLNSVLVHSARVVGPAIAGVLIALWGVEPCFLLNAASFGVMVAALWRMDPRQLDQTPRAERKPGAIRAGLRYVRSTRKLALPLALMALVGTLGFNFHTLLPLLARFSFEGDASAYAVLAVAMGTGSVAGALVNAARGRVDPGLIAGAALAFGALGLIAAAAPTLALEALALAALGAASVTFAASINSWLQLTAEPTMRGRVMALFSIVFIGSTAIGGPLAGWLSEAVDPRAALVMAGVAALAAGLAAHAARGAPVSSRLARSSRTLAR
jgi:MFS family permease